MKSMPHPAAIFERRRQHAAALRAGTSLPAPEDAQPLPTAANDKPLTLTAADRPLDRPKLPSPLFLTGGIINFY